MHRLLATLAIPVAFAAALALPQPAEACGGFFCNRVPVDQTGEHILFAQDGDYMEAHVLVQYAGPAESFAWIVPVTARPEVGVSSATIFSRLSQVTGARYYINEYEELGQCDYYMFGATEDADVAAGAGGSAPPPQRNDGVTVVDQGQTGPYEYAILQATSVDPLFDWLTANSYDIPAESKPMVEPYVLKGGEMHFVAFRLQKGTDVGDIQPIKLRYLGDEPCVPIKLTAIATQPDLGVTVNLLDDARHVPENYLHVHVNEARINWLAGGSNYNDLITEAMNEAGGQGFATEFAGASSKMKDQFYVEGQYNTAALSSITDPVQFMNTLQGQGFTADSQLMNLFRKHLPMPQSLVDQGVDERSFYNCLECYSDALVGYTFDPVAFANDLEETIVAPLRHAQDLFDRIPYLTRLYTTLSAEEMTVDPIFVENAEMGDVNNEHTAKQIVDCRNGGDYYSAPIIIELSDGRRFYTSWNDDRTVLDTMPAAARIERTAGTSGPSLIQDNGDIIGVVLNGTKDDIRGCYGCGNSGGGDTALFALGFFGLLLVRRRR